MSPELLLALFATALVLSFPLWSWTVMLTAAEEHEEWQQKRRERQATGHREVIEAALASVPMIVDIYTAPDGSQKSSSAKWAPAGFVPGTTR